MVYFTLDEEKSDELGLHITSHNMLRTNVLSYQPCHFHCNTIIIVGMALYPSIFSIESNKANLEQKKSFRYSLNNF